MIAPLAADVERHAARELDSSAGISNPAFSALLYLTLAFNSPSSARSISTAQAVNAIATSGLTRVKSVSTDMTIAGRPTPPPGITRKMRRPASFPHRVIPHSSRRGVPSHGLPLWLPPECGPDRTAPLAADVLIRLERAAELVDGVAVLDELERLPELSSAIASASGRSRFDSPPEGGADVRGGLAPPVRTLCNGRELLERHVAADFAEAIHDLAGPLDAARPLSWHLLAVSVNEKACKHPRKLGG